MTALHPRVAQLALDAGLVVTQDAAVLRVGTSDTSLVVRDDDGTIRVDAVERGVVEGIDLRTSSRDLLDRFLALRVGLAWRSRHGLAQLPTPGRLDLPEGVGTHARPDGTATVTTPDGDAEVTSVTEAGWLALTVGHTVDEVLASLRAPDGGLLFTSRRPRGLRRVRFPRSDGWPT